MSFRTIRTIMGEERMGGVANGDVFAGDVSVPGEEWGDGVEHNEVNERLSGLFERKGREMASLVDCRLQAKSGMKWKMRRKEWSGTVEETNAIDWTGRKR
jgi:hypothetical protein